MRGIGVLGFRRERRVAWQRSAGSSKGKGKDKSKTFLLKDKEQAIHLVGEIDGVPGIVTFGAKGGSAMECQR